MSLFNFWRKNDEEAATPSPYYQVDTTKLPDNFAQNVMELEMQMEFVESCGIEVVQQLN